MGMTTLTLDTELSADQREFLEAIETSSDSLLVVINGILDYATIEAGRVTLSHTEFALRAQLEEIAAAARAQAEEKGLELRWSVEDAVPQAVVGDQGRLRQIVVHLVDNAIKFTDRGHVRLHVGVDGASDRDALLHVRVEDTGCGIPHEKRELIFERFSQGESFLTRSRGGTGLGLATARHLVRQMDGMIWVDSEVGAGSTFHFTALLGLPQEAVAEAMPQASLAELTPSA